MRRRNVDRLVIGTQACADVVARRLVADLADATCDLVAGRATLVIELKGRLAGDTKLAARTADVLASYGGPVAAMSFDPGLMGALRNLAPALALGLVGMRRDAGAPVPAQMSALRYLRQALAARLQFLAYRVADLLSPGTTDFARLTGIYRVARGEARSGRCA